MPGLSFPPRAQPRGVLRDTRWQHYTFVEQADPRWGIQAPLLKSLSVQTPGGLVNNVASSRPVTLSNPADPLSLTTQRDTLVVNGQIFTSVYDAVLRRSTSTTPEPA